uniref:DUF4201 domain-containing protein n=1 Tax=Macrostomum lignano TaxID=282301 RepID=A0A1I8HIA7_9PLAT
NDCAWVAGLAVVVGALPTVLDTAQRAPGGNRKFGLNSCWGGEFNCCGCDWGGEDALHLPFGFVSLLLGRSRFSSLSLFSASFFSLAPGGFLSSLSLFSASFFSLAPGGFLSSRRCSAFSLAPGASSAAAAAAATCFFCMASASSLLSQLFSLLLTLKLFSLALLIGQLLSPLPSQLQLAPHLIFFFSASNRRSCSSAANRCLFCSSKSLARFSSSSRLARSISICSILSFSSCSRSALARCSSSASKELRIICSISGMRAAAAGTAATGAAETTAEKIRQLSKPGVLYPADHQFRLEIAAPVPLQHLLRAEWSLHLADSVLVQPAATGRLLDSRLHHWRLVYFVAAFLSQMLGAVHQLRQIVVLVVILRCTAAADLRRLFGRCDELSAVEGATAAAATTAGSAANSNIVNVVAPFGQGFAAAVVAWIACKADRKAFGDGPPVVPKRQRPGPARLSPDTGFAAPLPPPPPPPRVRQARGGAARVASAAPPPVDDAATAGFDDRERQSSSASALPIGRLVKAAAAARLATDATGAQLAPAAPPTPMAAAAALLGARADTAAPTARRVTRRHQPFPGVPVTRLTISTIQFPTAANFPVAAVLVSAGLGRALQYPPPPLPDFKAPTTAGAVGVVGGVMPSAWPLCSSLIQVGPNAKPLRARDSLLQENQKSYNTNDLLKAAIMEAMANLDKVVIDACHSFWTCLEKVAAPEATETEPAPPAQEEEEPAPQQEEAVEAPAAEGAAEAPDDEAGSGEAGEATVTASEQPAEAADGEEAATEEAHGKAEDDGEVGDAAAGEEEAKAEGEATDGDAAAEAGDQQQSDEAAAAEGAGTGEEAAAAEGEEGAAGGEATAEAADGEGDGEAKAEGEEAAASGETGEGTGEEAMATGESAEDGQAEAADGEEGEQPPTSETFADGERAESPARVSEKLSREPTPTGEERQQADRIDEVDEEAERPEPTSPDEMVATFDEIGIEGEEGEEEEEEEEEYEEEEVEEEEFNRELMIASYKQAMQEREQKLHQNSLLQTKLSDYFRRKKADQGGQAEASQETEKSITDQEQRYAKFVANLDELRRTRDSKRLEFDDRIQELELECQSREEEMRLLYQSQLDAKRKVGLKAVSATNGRPFPAVTQKRSEAAGGGKAQDPLSTSVDDMLQDEASLEDQVARVRLDNIGLSNRVRKCETSLKAKEELSEGLHMIDFEQLKIENQTYNEKIEERQEELLKLKKKITNNVQVLTHLKEKLQFVQCKRQEQCESLDQLDQTLSKRRDQLTRTKQTRDSLRNDNQRLKQNSGLLGNEALLRNFEENADLVTEKRGRLESLKTQHSEATLQCSKLKRKIDVARAQSAHRMPECRMPNTEGHTSRRSNQLQVKMLSLLSSPRDSTSTSGWCPMRLLGCWMGHAAVVSLHLTLPDAPGHSDVLRRLAELRRLPGVVQVADGRLRVDEGGAQQHGAKHRQRALADARRVRATLVEHHDCVATAAIVQVRLRVGVRHERELDSIAVVQHSKGAKGKRLAAAGLEGAGVLELGNETRPAAALDKTQGPMNGWLRKRTRPPISSTDCRQVFLPVAQIDSSKRQTIDAKTRATFFSSALLSLKLTLPP